MTCSSAYGAALIVSCCIASGCSSGSTLSYSTNPQVYSLDAPIPKGGGRRFVGKPHFINGRWYRPRHEPNYDETGIAAWYGEKFRGRRTANGEFYDNDRLTAAHPTLPLPSYIEITSLENGKMMVLRVNDRGPYIDGRVIDVSSRVAGILGFKKKGTAPVRVRYLGPAPLNGDDSYEERIAAQRSYSAPRTVAEYPCSKEFSDEHYRPPCERRQHRWRPALPPVANTCMARVRDFEPCRSRWTMK